MSKQSQAATQPSAASPTWLCAPLIARLRTPDSKQTNSPPLQCSAKHNDTKRKGTLCQANLTQRHHLGAESAHSSVAATKSTNCECTTSF
jgi:hypothetical protein